MEPVLRAAADRLIHNGGLLAYVTAHASELGLDRTVEATGLTVRQTIGHIVAWTERDADAMDGIVPDNETTDRDAFNRQVAEREKDADAADLLRRYGRARDRLIAAFERIPPELANRPAGPGTLAQVVNIWTAHPGPHALDFAEALPEIAFDALLLEWALHAIPASDSDRARQDALRDRARAYYASLPPGEDDDDEEGE